MTTSTPLLSRRLALGALAGSALLAQRPAPEPQPSEPGFEGGGGKFGGGGASGRY